MNTTNNFLKELPADSILDNTRRQVEEAFYSFVEPKKTKKAAWIHFNPEMAQVLGLENELPSKKWLDILSGNTILENTKPYAMCYGGHQFGHWAGQLGDGRAINLFEIEKENKNWSLQLKGAGPTPYSRTADGLAVLRSSIREYLCAEAMHYLGVPSTRSLSLILSGDEVLRDVMYNGNQAFEKGAIVCRMAPSFIRFGSFEIFASRKDKKNLKRLADYTLKHFYPDLITNGSSQYVNLFQTITNKTLDMILHWQRVGFVHGVMNTDNMSIHGITIDYGPYGWLDDYNPEWTPNTTDKQHKRYRYGNQPYIALWNLYMLANALHILIEETKPFEEILERFKITFDAQYLQMMHQKIGIDTSLNKSTIDTLEKNLQLEETDMTIFFRLLASIKKTSTAREALDNIYPAFYTSDIKEESKKEWLNWFVLYLDLLKKESNSDEERKKNMNAINPKYVLRNYMAQQAIEKADEGDYSLVQELFTLIQQPYNEQPKMEHWFAKRPDWARHKIGCSMLSCSS